MYSVVLRGRFCCLKTIQTGADRREQASQKMIRDKNQVIEKLVGLITPLLETETAEKIEALLHSMADRKEGES